MAAQRQWMDTNVLVRFFTGDPPDMAAKARRLVARADADEITLLLAPVIVAETFYTLESFFEIERRDVAEKLATFIQCRGVHALERNRLLNALERCQRQNAHFADAYLAATASERGEPVASFDRDFDKFKDVIREEPQ